MNYKKITRRVARKLYESAKPFIITPGDFRPDSWAACPIDGHDNSTDSFDSLCNAFKYYNASISSRMTFWAVA